MFIRLQYLVHSFKHRPGFEVTVISSNLPTLHSEKNHILVSKFTLCAHLNHTHNFPCSKRLEVTSNTGKSYILTCTTITEVCCAKIFND